MDSVVDKFDAKMDSIPDEVRDTVRQQLKEEERKWNLIISGVKESDDELEDEDKVRTMFKVVGVKNPRIKEIFRLAKRKVLTK